MTVPLSSEDMKTLISIDSNNTVIIDTTIGSDSGITCHSTHRKGITIRNLI